MTIETDQEKEFQKEAYGSVLKADKLIASVPVNSGTDRKLLISWLQERGTFHPTIYEGVEPGSDDELSITHEIETAQSRVDELLSTLPDDELEFINNIRSAYNILSKEAQQYRDVLRDRYVQREILAGLTTEEAERAWGAKELARVATEGVGYLEPKDNIVDSGYMVAGSVALWLLKGAEDVQIAKAGSTQHEFTITHSVSTGAIKEALYDWNRRIGDIDCATWGEGRGSFKNFIAPSAIPEQSHPVLKDHTQILMSEVRPTNLEPEEMLVVSIGDEVYPLVSPVDMLAFKLIQATQRSGKDYSPDFAAIENLITLVGTDQMAITERVNAVIRANMSIPVEKDDVAMVKKYIDEYVPSKHQHFFDYLNLPE